MSHVIKGFCTINNMSDGILNNIAPLGELSTYARTFSTHKTSISNSEYENVSATIFSSRENGIDMDLPIGVDIHMLAILEDLATVFVSDIDFDRQFFTRYPDYTLTGQGNLILHDEILLPSFLSWDSVVNGEPCSFTVWLSNDVFVRDYDLFEIRVVPPIPNVLDLRGDTDTLLSALADYGVSEQIQAQETVRANDPSTKTATLKLKWVDAGSGNSIDLTWVLVIFGTGGLLYAHQLEAIRQYLLQQTGIIPDEWVVNFPDLIITTNFTIIPSWDRVALASSGSMQYVYSPVIRESTIRTLADKRYPDGTSAAMLDMTVYGVIPYKSMGFVAIPELTNNEDVRWDEVYPDFCIIPLNDININRLAESTRLAMVAMELGVRLADSDDGTVTLPTNINRLIEDSNTYLTYMVSGIKHRILTRQSFMEE